MSNENIFLRERLGEVSDRRMYVAPRIDESKLNNAIQSFGYKGAPNNVVAILDDSFFGSAKEGILFTGELVIYRPTFSDPIVLQYQDLISVEYVEQVVDAAKGKNETFVRFNRKDGVETRIDRLMDGNLKLLAEVLNVAVNDFDRHVEEAQSIPLEDMDEEVKVAYIQIAINKAYDDNQLQPQEFAELLLLMTRLNMQAESRQLVRSYMASPDAHVATEQLIAQMGAFCPDGQEQSVHVSLAKELLNLHLIAGGRDADDFEFLKAHRSLLKIKDGELETISMALNIEREMLKEEITDDQLTDAIKLLSAKAAAVGTPMAAVYLSGSVIGLSAAGMTSGLATLGIGGILGLSSMATGIGVAVLLGVGAYAGVRKLTGADQLSRSKRRALMLNEVIKQTQATLSLLISDINFVTARLNDLILNHQAQGEKFEKLMQLLRQLTNAGTVLANRSEEVQSSATKINCAHFLDVDLVRRLTRDPTRQDLGQWIIDHYEPKVVSEDKDGAIIEVERVTLREGYDARELEKLAQAFQTIGYFNVSDVVLGKAVDIADKTVSGIKGLFS